jgi:hypothetical protein
MTTLKRAALGLLLAGLTSVLLAAQALADSDAPPSSTPSSTPVVVIVGIAVGLVALVSARALWKMSRERRWERAYDERMAAKRNETEAAGGGPADQAAEKSHVG